MINRSVFIVFILVLSGCGAKKVVKTQNVNIDSCDHGNNSVSQDYNAQRINEQNGCENLHSGAVQPHVHQYNNLHDHRTGDDIYDVEYGGEYGFSYDDHFGNDANIYDPLEKYNRFMFAINYQIDRFLFRPLSLIYKRFVPKWSKDRINNVLDNMRQPFYAVQGILTLNPKMFAVSTVRFVLNTTMGFFGMFDFAYKFKKIATMKTSGEQMLKSAKFRTGPYIMLPIFGPSFCRGALGIVIDRSIDPLNFMLSRSVTFSRGIVKGITIRSNLSSVTDQIEKNSIDKYAAVRYIYTQVHGKN